MSRICSVLLLAVSLFFCFSSAYGRVLVGRLPTLGHQVSGNLYIVNQTSLLIENFNYDGTAPAAYLYYYDTSAPYTASNIPRNGRGEKIPHPSTNSDFPNGRVTNKPLAFNLPANVYACDLKVFTIWCAAANTHFTAIDIPPTIFTTDPNEARDGSKILCNREGGGGGAVLLENCEQPDPNVQVEWALNRTSGNITVRVCGCVSSGDQSTWVGFGLSGSNTDTLMLGADATITYVDKNDVPIAVDYRLSAYTQCTNGNGACPDTIDTGIGNCTNDVTAISGSINNGLQCVMFTRKFNTSDNCDLVLDPDNQRQFVVWGVGPLGDTAFQHNINAKSGDSPYNFGRTPTRNCQQQVMCTAGCDPYTNYVLPAPTDTTFEARIGPSGLQRGYTGITGRAGWGIAWYINGTLIPELVVQRGKTYTFIVYGGDDSSQDVNYHPFYITNSMNGGRDDLAMEDRQGETIYAGVENINAQDERPVGVGPMCFFDTNVDAESILAECDSELCQYEGALTRPVTNCDSNAQGNTFTWTPDTTTPDLVYYQCYTHMNLGWKIRVTNSVEDYLKENDNQQQPPRSCGSTTLVSSSHLLLLSLLLFTSLTLLFSTQ